MKAKKTAYELSQSQVTTPCEVIELFWKLIPKKTRLSKVLDMGAGDCRFANQERIKEYVGIEIDPQKARNAVIPTNGVLEVGCAFKHTDVGYDACIGNPPYVRHHDLESEWRDRIAAKLDKQLGIKLNRKSNLFLYFMCLSILKTTDTGLIALVIPFEWVSRPSSAPVREYIKEKNWDVEVYRFLDPIFSDVLTTACITIIKKNSKDGAWKYYDIGNDGITNERDRASNSSAGVLHYESRGRIWALRGMSPGAQPIFCLTEQERLSNKLTLKDVMPCVTSMKNVPKHLKVLNRTTFNRYFVDAGERCWLVCSHRKNTSSRLKRYLSKHRKAMVSNYTCNIRSPWYRFKTHPIPKILISSGFTSHGPKMLRNDIKAHAIGVVCGIHSCHHFPINATQRYLSNMNFENVVVPHANKLKKVEVRQLNSVLNKFEAEELK